MNKKFIVICLTFIFNQFLCFPDKQFDYNNINWIKINSNGLELLLPENYLYKISKTEIIVHHFIPYKHDNMCDYVNQTILYYLTDLEWKIIINEGSLKNFLIKNNFRLNQFLKNENEFILQNGFIDKFSMNNLNGYIITSEHDGCGQREYFIVFKNKILYINRSHGELGTTSYKEVEKYLKLPGIILKEDEDKIFNKFIINILINNKT